MGLILLSKIFNDSFFNFENFEYFFSILMIWILIGDTTQIHIYIYIIIEFLLNSVCI